MVTNDIFQSVGDCFRENCRIHFFQIFTDDWFELHQIKNLGLKVNARGNFCKHKSFWSEFKYSTFCDKMHFLMFFSGYFSIIGNLLYFIYEFDKTAFFIDMKMTILKRAVETLPCKRRAEDNMFGIGCYIDKTTGSGRIWTESGCIDISVRVNFTGTHVVTSTPAPL